MAFMNRVQLLGNLTRDPELRELANGTAVSDLGLAVNEVGRTREGEKFERTCFVDITVWDKQALACEKYLKKGRPILVEGHLQLDQWQNEAGEKRSKLRVRADRVHFLHTGPGRREE